MPIIKCNNWYSTNKLDIAKYHENRLYEPEQHHSYDTHTWKNKLNGNNLTYISNDKLPLDSEISDMLDVASKSTANTCYGDVNTDGVKTYDRSIWFSLPTKADQKAYRKKYKRRYRKIFYAISKYKLHKTKHGEDEQIDSKETIVNTIKMSKLDIENRHKMATMYLIMLKEGRLWLEFNSNICANIFYRRKDRCGALTAVNSRCLADCDNLFKIICRHVKYAIIEEIFVRGLVNTNINRARRCFIKYYDDKTRDTYRRLCFESIANIGCILHKTKHQYILLDLSNAYNNVTFSFLATLLSFYLPNPNNTNDPPNNTNDTNNTNNHTKKQHNKTCANTCDNIDAFYDVKTNDELKNISNAIVHMMREIRYYDRQNNIEILRNKGVPQGSAISIDLFIICMDYILKQCIKEIKIQLGLHYNVDYKLVAYVDDILVLLKNEIAYIKCNNIIDTISHTFANYNFKMNDKKTKCSPLLVDKYHCNSSPIQPSDKYLGIYIESDPAKYLQLVATEMAKRYSQIPYMQSFREMDNAAKLNILKSRDEMCIRGKLQYVLSPFASDKFERASIMEKMGYPHIAALFTKS